MNYELSPLEKIILETLRNNNDVNKSVIVEKSNLPWSTVSSAITSLSQKGFIDTKTEKSSRDNVKLKDESVFFVGISVGTANVKIAITSLLCEPISTQNELLNKISKNISDKFEQMEEFGYKNNTLNCLAWCFPTPSSYMSLSNLLSAVCNIIVTECNGINIASIGFVLPGHIDFENQRVISSKYSNQSLKISHIRDLLNTTTLDKLNNSGIDLFIDHNVKASASYEFSYIQKNGLATPNNFAVIYQGFGLGMGIILNGSLVRGINNVAGQFGHITVPKYPKDFIKKFFGTNGNPNNHNGLYENDDECFGELEQLIREEVFYQLLKEHDSSVSSQPTPDELATKYKSTAITKFVEWLEADNVYRQILAYYLGKAICDAIKLLSIDTLVFTGKLAKLYPVIKTEFQYVIMESQFELNVITSNVGEFSAAFGAAEIAYRKKLNIFI